MLPAGKYSRLASLSILILAASFLTTASPPAEIDVRNMVQQECSIKEQISNRSSLNISVSDISSEIKLNGSTVEMIDCSELERYTYPDAHTSHSSSSLTTPSFTSFLLMIVLPVSILFISGIAVGRIYSLEWLDIGKYLATVIVTLTASGLSIIFMNEYLYQLDFILMPIAFLVFGSPFIASAATYYTGTGESDKPKVNALVAFLFSIMIYWMISAYLLLTTRFMV